MNERIFYLLGKMLAGEATKGELQELNRIETSDEEASLFVEEISKWWKSKQKSGQEESEKALQRHLQRMQEEGLPFPSSLKEIFNIKKKKR